MIPDEAQTHLNTLTSPPATTAPVIGSNRGGRSDCCRVSPPIGHCHNCANNLKQIALAAHNHHDTLGTLPAGARISTPQEPMPYISWRVALLPQLEQQAFWSETLKAFTVNGSPFSDAHTHLRAHTQKVFSCPQDDRLTTAWLVRPYSGGGLQVALSSYMGVSETRSQHKNGMIYAGSSTRLLHVMDGTSNTLMIGERPPSRDLIYGWWYAGSGQGQGSVDSHLGVQERNFLGGDYRACRAEPYESQGSTVNEHCSAFHYWSLHPGGAHFALGDGSVRFLRYSARDIMPALATRSGGEVASVPD